MKVFTIKNNSIELTVLEYGAIIQSLVIKDKNGKLINAVVGYKITEDYLENPMYLGACIGRYAGRISNGEFSLKGKKYDLFEKNGVHLHGGKIGFNQKYFIVEEINQSENPFIKLSYLSPDLEEGYPGNLKVTVTYTLIGSSLKISYEATTDKTTVVNLTNHSYFKLDLEPCIDAYELQLNCPEILETLENLLPTGKLIKIDSTKYDFLNKTLIGKTRLDTPFVLNNDAKIAATISSKISGITMQVSTNQPAMVIYTPSTTGSICFETQNFPDAPNHANFPSSVLKPNEKYYNVTLFTFTIE